MNTDNLNIYRMRLSFLSDNKKCVEWLINQELLPNSKNCTICRQPMSLDIESHGFGGFKCRKTHSCNHEIEYQLSKNTWFEEPKIHPIKAVLLTYAFANDMTFEQAIRESCIDSEETPSETVLNWYFKCREICMDALDDVSNDNKIGGKGYIVEIEEFKIGRRMYNRGRPRLIKDNWILGIIDDHGGYILEIYPENKRNRDNLETLIIKHIAPGSIIITDCWKGYTELTEQEFYHFIVNHKYHFVDPETAFNTDMIEYPWRLRLSRGEVKNEDLAMHLCEFLWRRKNVNEKVNSFSTLLRDIKKLYPLSI